MCEWLIGIFINGKLCLLIAYLLLYSKIWYLLDSTTSQELCAVLWVGLCVLDLEDSCFGLGFVCL